MKDAPVNPSATFEIGGSWGNAINWLDVKKLTVVGWKSTTPRVGDGLKSKMASGKTGVYRFVSVKRQWDPPDMFFGTVEFVRYDEP